MSWSRKAGIVLPGYDPLQVANAPTIGTATAGGSNCASVTFTAPSCTGGSVITTYTVFSNCGAKTATGASSPITVTGLSAGTSYTFKVIATNIYGPSYPSAASNSITATFKTCDSYTTAGTYSWVAPSGVTSVAVVAVGGGGGGAAGSYVCCGYYTGGGGGGGGLGYKNNYSVTPGNSYTVVVGASGTSDTPGCNGGNSYFVNTSTVRGGGGVSPLKYSGGSGGTYTGDGGGNGGSGGTYVSSSEYVGGGGGGGAGGYSGAGGAGGACSASAGSGGGGGGGAKHYAGGGVGIFGQGANGTAGTTTTNAGGGSGGENSQCSTAGKYGGGGMGGPLFASGTAGAVGAVRIVYCKCGVRGTPSFPSTNVGA